MSSRYGQVELRPLGSLAPPASGRAWSGDRLDRSSVLSVEVRQQIVGYLTGCPVFLAWMEYTRDVIGDRFGVSGGSAIASDGVYYWRLDAVEYVREYGIPVPGEALHHFENAGWQPPEFSRPEYLAIYEQLDSVLGGGEEVG